MIVKIHKSLEGRTILAACDSKLIGKKIEEGNLQLDLTSNFYKGEEMKEDRVKELIKSVHIVNLVGEKAVALGISEGVVSKEHIIKIGGVSHAQGTIVREGEN